MPQYNSASARWLVSVISYLHEVNAVNRSVASPAVQVDGLGKVDPVHESLRGSIWNDQVSNCHTSEYIF